MMSLDESNANDRNSQLSASYNSDLSMDLDSNLVSSLKPPKIDLLDLFGLGDDFDSNLMQDTTGSNVMVDDDQDLLEALNEDPMWGDLAPSALNDTQIIQDQNSIDINERVSAYNTLSLFSPKLESHKSTYPNREYNTDTTRGTSMQLFDEVILENKSDNSTPTSLSIIKEKESATRDNHEPNKETDRCTQNMELLEIVDNTQASEKPATDNAPKDQSQHPKMKPIDKPSTGEHNSRFSVSLRQRRDIQLHPFTLEKERYHQLISRLNLKRKLHHTERDDELIETAQQNNEDSEEEDDKEYIPNTSLIDEPDMELQPTQSILDELNSLQETASNISSKKNLTIKQRSKPSKRQKLSTSSEKGKGRVVINLGNNSATADILEKEANSTQLSNLPELDKYGLGKLVMPTLRRPETKRDQITFNHKKNKRKASMTRTSLPARFSQPIPTKDIFAFDMLPKPVNPFLSASNSKKKSPKTSLGSEGSASTSEQNVFYKPTQTDPSSPLMLDMDDYNGSSPPYFSDDDNGEDQDEDEDEIQAPRRRLKHRTALESSDEEDDDENTSSTTSQILTQAELDEIYTFPTSDTASGSSAHLDLASRLASSTSNQIRGTRKSTIAGARRLTAKMNSLVNDIIVDDGFNYRTPKFDEKSKKKALNRMLPASFEKVYRDGLITSSRPKGDGGRSESTATVKKKKKKANLKDTEDVFAQFRESDSDSNSNSSSSESESGNTDVDHYADYDGGAGGYVLEMQQEASIRQQRNSSGTGLSSIHGSKPTRMELYVRGHTEMSQAIETNRLPSHQNANRFLGGTSNSNKNSTRVQSSKLLRNANSSAEATEDNRILKHYSRPSSSVVTQVSRNENSRSRRQKPPPPKSSVAIAVPDEADIRAVHQFGIKSNPVPKRRRKRPKRSVDDIYIHKPITLALWKNIFEQPVNMAQFPESILADRKAFDDIYVGTKYSSRYADESAHKGISALLDNGTGTNIDLAEVVNRYFEGKQVNHVSHNTIHNVVKRVRSLLDHDLRRCSGGFHQTVYLHKGLFQPLLTPNPNLKSAYAHLKSDYTELQMFGKTYYWKQILPDNELIRPFFHKISQDIHRFFYSDDGKFTNNKFLPEQAPSTSTATTDLSYHEHFYVFCSLLLTQWIPCLSYTQGVELTEQMTFEIRGLAYMISKIIDNNDTACPNPHSLYYYKIIIKAMLYMLDWTCRLHHLGVDRTIWSVTEYSQILIDVLVSIGYKDIHQEEWIAEAWVCLIQLISVSDRKAGYYLSEQVFEIQLNDAIKRKTKIGRKGFEHDSRRNSYKWAETLHYILDKYLML